jgi:Tol biopolymer transport system component
MQRRHLIPMILLAALVSPATAAAETGDTLLVSRATGAQGAKASSLSGSHARSISADGRYVLFDSGARNLVRGAGDNPGEVYVRDLWTDTVELVSRKSGANGSSGDEGSAAGAISGDGRFAAFVGGRDMHPAFSRRDYGPLLVRDRERNRTVLVARASGANGAPANGAAWDGVPSFDGRFVAFASSASNLHRADRDRRDDVFVRDLRRNRTLLASGGNGSSGYVTISDNGRYVAFASTATDLHPDDLDRKLDVYVRDLRTGEITLVSRGPGFDGVKGDGAAMQPWISGDGRFVAFVFRGSNMLSDDTDRTSDVYLRDLALGTTELVSRGPDAKGNGDSDGPTISSDGRFVAFDSLATNLDPDDTDTAADIYVHDAIAGTTELVSRATGPTGAKAAHPEALRTADSFLAADGRSIAFDSNATNLHPHDRDDNDDVFVRELGGA